MDLRIQLARYKNTWRVQRAIKIVLHHKKHNPLTVHIHRLFTTDLASVPRIPILYPILSNRTVAGAVIHDWMYTKQIKRVIADDYFLMLMEYEGVKKRYRYPIYWAVRLFGRARYKNKGGL